MATANATATASPATHFKATLTFKAPSLYQLGPHFQPLQHSLPLNDTVENVLSWVKREIVQRLRQEPTFMTGGHQGLIDNLGNGGVRPDGFVFSHAPVTRSPIISFATSVSAISNGQQRGEIGLDNEQAQRVIAIQDLCLDPQQLSTMSIEIRATLHIAPKPDRVPAVTNANMLNELVHSRSQAAKYKYVRVGTLQDNRAAKIGYQSSKLRKAAPHNNAILAQFDPFDDRSWTKKIHIVPFWTYDNFTWGLADCDASMDWCYENMKDHGNTNLWADFDRDEPERTTNIEGERARQIGLSAADRIGEAGKLTRIAPERPQLTFNRLDLAQFGNGSGVGIPATAAVHAIVHFEYHYQDRDPEDSHFPRNMQIRVRGNMTVDGLEDAVFTASSNATQEEDQILRWFKDRVPRPPCEWWVMPAVGNGRTLYKVDDTTLEVASYINSAASLAANTETFLYMECHIWDPPISALVGLG